MTEIYTAYDSLKNFNGLIHRQPLFISKKLDVDSYHLTFLDTEGNPLGEDAPVPDFLSQLSAILKAINHNQKTLLTIPGSWQKALFEYEMPGIDLIIEANDRSITKPASSHVSYAENAKSNVGNGQTLLIDLEEFSENEISENLPKWRQQHPVLCALNVNAFSQFSLCQLHDIDLLQGFFYTLPDNSIDKKIAPAAQTLMELLVKLQDPEVEVDELAEIINQDVALSYKLLRLINSAFFGLPREVGSTRQAIVMLGQNKIKTWASLLCLSGLDDKPNELRTTAMIRGRMCELLAKHYKGHADVFFAAGLFSTLDALMDKPLEVLLQDLPLSEELHSALLHKEGPAGNALNQVLNYERGNWSAIDYSVASSDALLSAYLDALYWAKELNLQLND
ncbi:MAG TPA: histidine kinase [Methylophaga sp.]|jgi:EAL and modified HD-GYP domain-containing signal transduction protein|uniref:EAL and HDOD domain-containing protein n=2 Tax=Methylophaga TaxID=40222 RepID=UPI000C8AD08F|nr:MULTISPECIES: HDOD domain-containing protein [unclassified Methylophaga]MAP27172.1 histidine kinase [Methylophaga sp.]HAD32212.1 histidine kinase [Methylophaga sp.]|tara:strand:- start:10452 stop:11630 length:1179 start_codon:yes stop_codon:yes gene_type:complete